MQTWIGSQPGMGRSIIDHDPRNHDFPTRGVLHAADAPLVEKAWRRGSAYDQGQTPQCVAYSGKGMLNTSPFSKFVDYEVRSKYVPKFFYDGAQLNDEWPGEDYDGTSALGLLRFLTQQKIVKEYRWCFGLKDVLQTLSHWGPVCIGTNWHQSMFTPDENYFIEPDSATVGGHQYQLVGIDPSKRAVEIMNSWGKYWGDRGRAWMSYESLEYLLNDQGDAYTLVALDV